MVCMFLHKQRQNTQDNIRKMIQYIFLKPKCKEGEIMANQYTKNQNSKSNQKNVRVAGYNRKDGTHVAGYTRSMPNR